MFTNNVQSLQARQGDAGRLAVGSGRLAATVAAGGRDPAAAGPADDSAEDDLAEDGSAAPAVRAAAGPVVFEQSLHGWKVDLFKSPAGSRPRER